MANKVATGPITGQLRWIARALSREPNPLRRRGDRCTAVLMAGLMVLALAVLPIAAAIGHGTHQRLLADAAEQATTRQQVTARLIEPPRMRVLARHPQVRDVRFEALAGWQAPGGGTRTGLINVESPAAPGDSETVWIDETARPVPPPLTTERALASAISVGVLLAGGGVLMCGAAVLAVRILTDARARRAWEREWEVVGPTWRGSTGKG